MARLQNSPIYADVKNARSFQEQIAALRSLKNEISGHVQRKEKWVESGILEPVVNLLRSSRAPMSRNERDFRGAAAHTRKLSEEEQVRLLALQLLGIFANGGPSFLAPIQATNTMPAILSNISPLDNPPQVVLAALRTLSSITEAAELSPSSSASTATLAEQLFGPLCLDAFHSILGSESVTATTQEQKRLVADLISRLCREDKHQNALAQYGILDALATMLASFVVARGEVIPRAEVLGRADGMDEMIPDPAPRLSNLAVTLDAISTIISESRFRTCMLIYSPAIMAVFPNTEFSPPRGSRTLRRAMDMAGLTSLRKNSPEAMEYLLPIVPICHLKSTAPQVPQFPPLGFSMSRENLATIGRTNPKWFPVWDPTRVSSPTSNGGDAELDENESPLVPWLIHLVRSAGDIERVMAASVLASLFKAGFADPQRESAIGNLVVPILCRLIKDANLEATSTSSDAQLLEPRVALDRAVLERSPTVLARLIAGSELLQVCAHGCGIVKTVCSLLFGAYEPVPEQSPPRPWSPVADGGADRGEGHWASRMGPPGYLPLYSHRLKLREGALKLIAAIVPLKEEIRMAFIDQDAVPYIVESLSPNPTKPRHIKDRAKPERAAARDKGTSTETSPYGTNPNSVIIAACHVIRLLSRSISILRTSLEDHGVAMPIFKLLRHSDKDVQVAACAVVCNLVLEMSPMRQPLVELGIVKVLCEHAHSLDAELRHNAMWALKHLVLEVDNDLKKRCLEELESGWLVQLICDDTEDEALFARLRRERNGRDEDDEDEDMDLEGIEEDSRPWLWPALYRTKSTRSTSHRSQSARVQMAEKKLTALREAELNPVRKARNDDLAIQEQGLNFIRNLIGPPGCSGIGSESPHDLTEMVDYVFSELGQDRLFEILASKLRVKVLHAFDRRQGHGRETRVLYPQPRIIDAVVCILVHMAASIPRHRQLVVAQTELLRLLGNHFNSKDIGVRRALCHLLANLVWKEDDMEDAQACAQRALELKKLGFLSKLEGLEHDDGELDVRERARETAWSLKQMP